MFAILTSLNTYWSGCHSHF